MSQTRRELLTLGGTVIGGSWFTGCLGIPSDGEQDSDGQVNGSDPETSDTGDTNTKTPDAENDTSESGGEQGDDQDMNEKKTENGSQGTETETATESETSSLASPLSDLVEAQDKEAFAEDHDLHYRNGEVKVKIELAPDGDQPDEHLTEVTDTYGSTVIAWVVVDRLVDLAEEDDVWRVNPYRESQPSEG